MFGRTSHRGLFSWGFVIQVDADDPHMQAMKAPSPSEE